MDKIDAQRLIQLRTHVLDYYSRLDGKDTVAAVVNQHNVANWLESIIHSLDDLLVQSGHVTLESEN